MTNKTYTTFQSNHGFATILTLVLITAVVLVLSAEAVALVTNNLKISRNETMSAKAYYAAESGIEDAIYRIIRNKNYAANYSLAVNENQTLIAISSIEGLKNIEAEGSHNQIRKKIKAVLSEDIDAISFHYGAQAGDWGLKLKNNAVVSGNVYSNGNIIGQGLNSIVTGDAWTTGSTHSIESIKINTDAHAHTIKNASIDRDAYFQSLINTTVTGSQYPGSPDPPIENLPISYAQIQEWEASAEAGGVITPGDGTYEPANNSSIGPVKINGNLRFEGNKTVTITGPVWVSGNIYGDNNAIIKLNNSLTNGFPIVADKIADQANYGKIDLENNIIMQDSQSGGYLLLISTNQSVDESNPAISVENNVNQDNPQAILFSLQGVIKVQNNAKFKEITGYGLVLENNAQIIYDQGLINANFSSGPGGGWTLTEWRSI